MIKQMYKTQLCLGILDFCSTCNNRVPDSDLSKVGISLEVVEIVGSYLIELAILNLQKIERQDVSAVWKLCHTIALHCDRFNLL